MATPQSSIPAPINNSNSHGTNGANTQGSERKQDKLPAPLDPFGNEVCLLFLKYGKCRYGKKCKLSHVKPDPDAPPPTRMVPVVKEESQPSIAPDVKFSLGNNKRPKPRPQVSSALVSTTSKPDNANVASGSLPPVPIMHDALTKDESKDILLGEERSQPSTTSDGSAAKAAASSATVKPAHKKRKKNNRESAGPAPLLAPYFVKPSHTSGRGTIITTTNMHGVATADSRPTTFTTKKKKGDKKKSATNTTAVPAERIEKWYISNRAELDPTTGRLVMTAGSPDTRGKKYQLKAMRRHHWECKQEVLQALERTIPKTYALKLVRSRIDWPRVTPYIALVLQAAFELVGDAANDQLAVLAMTVRVQLEHNELSGRDFEALLVSWGLSELQARRCGNLVWEMMVSAAGDASVAQARLGVGYIVRQVEDKPDFGVLRDKLSTFSEQQ